MKRFLMLTLSTIMLICSFGSITYGKKREEHNKDMENVFFGTSANKEQKEAAKVLEAAAYLTIDQYSGHGQKELALLKEKVKKDYPEISDIDISSSETSHHREYTHQGWDSKYRNIERKKNAGIDKEWPSKWELRKKILQDTVVEMFDFNWWNGIPLVGNMLPEYGERCDSMCALIYYSHLLGDHEETKDYEQYTFLMPVGGTLRGNDIIHELLYHCEVLFEKSLSGREYAMFESDLRRIDSKYFFLGKIKKEDIEKLQTNAEYAKKVISILQKYIPVFLQNEKLNKIMIEFGNVA